MVTLKFVFNQEKLKQAGKTEEELLQPMREHAKKYDIAEPEHGFFVKDGEDAMCVIGMFIPEITRKDVHYLDYLDEWTFDIDGEVEDCIKESRDWISHHERRYVGQWNMRRKQLSFDIDTKVAKAILGKNNYIKAYLDVRKFL